MTVASIVTATSSPNERTVPALVDGARVEIPCPTSWCTVDHAAENPRSLEDVSHSSERVAVSAPVGQHSEDVLVGQLVSFPFTDAPAPVLALDATGSGETAELSASAALAFADQLVAHAGRLRELAARMAGVGR